ncbi:acetyl-CoA carboxylase carboxyltransferase subunit alpha [Leptotrichia alba]|uniref:Acetyl-coenzyme A carboxylase carboxyl transferase subunit alpha n=1 Tax=Leptotrichia alba TaxID=3239304 RepID=A0AB39V6A1_9FUSO
MNIKDEIKELEENITELKRFSAERNIDFSIQIAELEKNLESKYKDFEENEMDAWNRIQISRNPERPYTLDYINELTQDFVELHGDRLSKDDNAIVGGLASIDGYKIMIIGQQKGRDIDSNIFRNFGMASPEGYRKALRLMRMAERFKLPILTLIDTSGAYPGIEAEEKGQGEAIAKNLAEMFGFRVPIVSVVIGEGGSGGALGIGVADSVLMFENSVYSVISPEGCASILFNDLAKAAEAAKSLKMDAISLKTLGVIDEIIKEPLGGAHRNFEETAQNLKEAVVKEFKRIDKYSLRELLKKRYEKYRKIGDFFED